MEALRKNQRAIVNIKNTVTVMNVFTISSVDFPQLRKESVNLKIINRNYSKTEKKEWGRNTPKQQSVQERKDNVRWSNI